MLSSPAFVAATSTLSLFLFSLSLSPLFPHTLEYGKESSFDIIIIKRVCITRPGDVLVGGFRLTSDSYLILTFYPYTGFLVADALLFTTLLAE